MCLEDINWGDKLNKRIGDIMQTLILIAHSEEKATQEEIDGLKSICNIYGRSLWTKKDELIKEEARDLLEKYFINVQSGDRNLHLKEYLAYKN